MPLLEECKKACADVFNIVKRGADNVKRPDLTEEERLELQYDITEMRKDSRKLAQESLPFAENMQVSMVYSYAHNVKKYGAARCMGQASLAASILLQKKIHCAIGIVKMDTDDQHVFVIAGPDRRLLTKGADVALLSPAVIVDSWIAMKCKGEGIAGVTGVFSPQEFAKVLARLKYATTLDAVNYIESPYV